MRRHMQCRRRRAGLTRCVRGALRHPLLHGACRLCQRSQRKYCLLQLRQPTEPNQLVCFSAEHSAARREFVFVSARRALGAVLVVSLAEAIGRRALGDEEKSTEREKDATVGPRGERVADSFRVLREERIALLLAEGLEGRA